MLQALLGSLGRNDDKADSLEEDSCASDSSKDSESNDNSESNEDSESYADFLGRLNPEPTGFQRRGHKAADILIWTSLDQRDFYSSEKKVYRVVADGRAAGIMV